MRTKKPKSTTPKRAKPKKVKDQYGRTPGSSSHKFKKDGTGSDKRNKVAGYGGGVKRKKSSPLASASKSTIRKSKKMSSAGKSRTSPRNRY